MWQYGTETMQENCSIFSVSRVN